jgi:catechol 2,3-dioxygenase-like lactoylglutathione lyase family enzyme
MSSKLSKADFATLIPIRNMDRAVKFYTSKLGGKLNMRAEGEMKDSWASIKIGREEFWLVNPPDPRPKIPDLSFFAFVVKDLKSVVKGLKNRGVRFQKAERGAEVTRVDGPISYSEFGASAFFNDTEGNLLMLWQNAEM